MANGAMDEAEGEDIVNGAEVHWVGGASNLLGIYNVELSHQTSENNGPVWFQEPDGGWLLWNYDPTDGEYYTQDPSGMDWSWSDWEQALFLLSFQMINKRNWKKLMRPMKPR